MYSVDINLLNDRPEYRPQTGGRKPKGEGGGGIGEIPGKTALIAGAAVAIAVPALVAGVWLYYTQVKNPQLQGRLNDIEKEIQALDAIRQDINNIKTESQNIQEQTNSLTGIFNYIKPRSALLQDIRDRTPPGVRISDIEEIEPESSRSSNRNQEEQAATSPVPPPPYLTISGIARSFSDVSDFVVLLQQSPFFEGSATQLLESSLADNPADEVQASEENFEGELSQVVEYKIQTQIRSVPSLEVLPELRRKGALGLVKRIQQLQQQGVLQP
jgi:type IV pilus assembly protein PilN